MVTLDRFGFEFWIVQIFVDKSLSFLTSGKCFMATISTHHSSHNLTQHMPIFFSDCISCLFDCSGSSAVGSVCVLTSRETGTWRRWRSHRDQWRHELRALLDILHHTCSLLMCLLETRSWSMSMNGDHWSYERYSRSGSWSHLLHLQWQNSCALLMKLNWAVHCQQYYWNMIKVTT